MVGTTNIDALVSIISRAAELNHQLELYPEFTMQEIDIDVKE